MEEVGCSAGCFLRAGVAGVANGGSGLSADTMLNYGAAVDGFAGVDSGYGSGGGGLASSSGYPHAPMLAPSAGGYPYPQVCGGCTPHARVCRACVPQPCRCCVCRQVKRVKPCWDCATLVGSALWCAWMSAQEWSSFERQSSAW